MKKLSAIAVALTLLGTTVSLAQYNDNPNRDREVTGQQDRNSSQVRGQDTNQRNQNGYQGGSQEQGRYDNQQGRNDIRDNPHWSRGDKLSSEYRDNRYVVSDWKSNHLRQPPRG